MLFYSITIKPYSAYSEHILEYYGNTYNTYEGRLKMAIMYMIVIFTVTCLLLLSGRMSKKVSSLKYLIPLIIGVISLGIVIISSFYGGLTGFGIGVINFAILIGSILSIIIILISEIIKEKSSKTYQ